MTVEITDKTPQGRDHSTTTLFGVDADGNLVRIDSLGIVAGDITDDAVTGPKIADGSITADKLDPGAISSGLITDATAIGLALLLAISARVGWDSLNAGFVNLASAATTSIGAQTSPKLQITGTTTITSLGSGTAGMVRTLRFSGALILTNGANLVLPNSQNITTVAGDVAEFTCTATNVWTLTSYNRANGSALFGPQAWVFTSSGSWTKPAYGTYARITAVGGGGGGGASNATTTASNGGESAVPVVAVFPLSSLPATLTIDVGGGGLGAASAPAVGGNGGNTRAWSGAGDVIVAPGGVGGSGTSATTWNGVTSLPTVASYGYPLLGAAYTGFTPPAWGTSGTPFADRARGAPKSATSGAAAQIGLTSVFGKGGNSSAANSGAGSAATGRGAGGGGGFATGGAGSAGYLLIEVF